MDKTQGVCWTAVWVGWHKAGLELSSQTGLVPAAPSLPASPPASQALHHPRVSQSFPASRPPQDKETEVEAEDKDKYGWHSPQGGSWFATGQSVTFGFWRAFPPSSSLLPTCSCCCSPPSAPDQRPVTTKRHSQVCSPEAVPRSQCVLKQVGQGGLAADQEKVGSREKGNLRARWPCVFNWLLGKAEKVMCTNQSGITDQSESEFRPPPPMRSRVFVPGSASPGPDRGSRAGGFIYQNKVLDWPRSRRRAG